MIDPHADLSEMHIVGDRTRFDQVRAESCEALRRHQIAHVGIGEAAAPYRVVRMDLPGAYVHCSLEGEGRVLLDGRWRVHRAGMVSVAPARALHAFHAVPETTWRLCWVRYTPASPRSLPGSMAPVLTAFDADALGFSILGLDAEMRASGDLGNCELFVDSIERYVSRIAEPWRRDGRLAAVWSEVQSALDHPWTLAELAAIAGVSEEHLRRICQSSLGRSPMKQLLMLRMEQAAHLLTISDHTVEAVGRAVGYENPFAFSNMFKRIMGRRPSAYRIASAAQARGN